MAHPDSGVDDVSDTGIPERLQKQDTFASDLNAQGYTDVLVLRRESGAEILTDRRLAIIEYLSDHCTEIDSVSDLARRLDRNKGAVSKDLKRLAELDIIEYEGTGDGEAKRPVLKHEHVVIEPVVY